MISETKLAPPGASLPTIERLVAKMLRGLHTRKSREESTARFLSERGKIRVLTGSIGGIEGSIPVLIERPVGLEDSSRYWSVWMTLDHLRIVNLALAGIIEGLGRDVAPEGVASTAAVKPSANAAQDVIPENEASCDGLLATAAAVTDLRTKLRFAHPWFGTLDAKAWHALAAVHMGIHRVQIERIVAGLVDRQFAK